MDKDDKSHKILPRYIVAMKQHSERFDFRIQVIVDEIEEMKNNNWQLRIKKEKAKTLDEIHKDFAKSQQPKHQHHKQHQRYNNYNNHQQQRYDNNNYNNNNKNNHSNNTNDKPRYKKKSKQTQINTKQQQQEKNPKEKIMSLIKESLTSGTCQDLIGFLQKNNNNSGCNKYWGEISNTIFINRSPTEIDIFIKFLIQLFDKKCIDNKDNQFVNESISFLAVNC